MLITKLLEVICNLYLSIQIIKIAFKDFKIELYYELLQKLYFRIAKLKIDWNFLKFLRKLFYDPFLVNC